MTARHAGGTPFTPQAMAEYIRCFSDPAAISASSADYRAAATIDLEHDDADSEAGRKVECPVLALWGKHSFVGQTYDVPAVWSLYATRLQGVDLPCNHYVPEEAPTGTVAALRGFLSDSAE